MKTIGLMSLLSLNGISYAQEMPVLPTEQEAKEYVKEDSNDYTKIMEPKNYADIIHPITLTYQVFDIVPKDSDKKDPYEIKKEIEQKLNESKNITEVFEQYGTILNYRYTTNTAFSNSRIININVENIPYVSETKKSENNSGQNDKNIYNSNLNSAIKTAKNSERIDFSIYTLDQDSIRLNVRLEEINLQEIQTLPYGKSSNLYAPHQTENYAIQDFKLYRGKNTIVHMSTALPKVMTIKDKDVKAIRFNVVKFD